MSEPDVPWRAFALAVGAIVSLRNGADPRRLGGFAQPEDAAAHLRGPCELADRDAVIERLRFLFEKGHSALWIDLAAVLASKAHVPTANLRFEQDPGEWTQSHEQVELVRHHPELADVGLVAWDMARLSNIAVWALTAGWLDERDAARWCTRAALRIQRTYAGFAAFGQSFRLGLEFWRRHSTKDDDHHYAWLLQNPESPWQRCEFERPLEFATTLDGTYVKAVSCASCGARKLRVSETAFVYCDGCGRLLDVDVAIALRQGEAPGPVYEGLRRELAPELERLRAAGDRAGYTAVQEQLMERYVSTCPAGVPARCRDPSYRRRYVAHEAACASSRDFSPECEELRRARDVLVERLRWVREAGGLRVQPTAFWAMTSLALLHIQACLRQYDADRLAAEDPDEGSRETRLRLALSTFALGWLPYLVDEDRDYLVDRCGLDEYVPAFEIAIARRTCPRCSASIEVAQGNRSYPCPTCGELSEASRSLPCTSCGAIIGVDADVTHGVCPFCRATSRAV